MPRDILSEYGNDSGAGNAPRAKSGGVKSARDVMGYSPPQGPSNIGDAKSPGLHGDNCGNCGSQGSYESPPGESGSPGLHGNNRGMGTNRRG